MHGSVHKKLYWHYNLISEQLTRVGEVNKVINEDIEEVKRENLPLIIPTRIQIINKKVHQL